MAYNTHPTTPESEYGSSWRRYGPRLAMVVLGMLAIAVTVAFYPVHQWIDDLLTWTQAIGVLGYVLMIVFYIIAAVLFLPGSILTLAAGFMFGVVIGTVVASIGSTLGAAAAFLTCRFLVRDMFAGRFRNSKRFSAVDQAVAHHGFKIVLLTRISPMFPFNLFNYIYGLTRVPFRVYLLASWIGMLPGTVLFVYVGATAADLAQIITGRVEVDVAQMSLPLVGLLVMLALIWLITRAARDKLRRELHEDEPGAPDANEQG